MDGPLLLLIALAAIRYLDRLTPRRELCESSAIVILTNLWRYIIADTICNMGATTT